jgi:hypothetical protein
MVSVCAFQTDKSFLHVFFAFMLKDNHTDVLLRLTSHELEKWLVEKQNERYPPVNDAVATTTTTDTDEKVVPGRGLGPSITKN